MEQNIFNMAVPFHPLSQHMLELLEWGSEKYPKVGRLRYVWMSENFQNIKLLLREGEGAWSYESDVVLNQVRNHPNFVSLETDSFDKTMVVATFSIPAGCGEKREMIRATDEMAQMVISSSDLKDKVPPITKDPMVLFHEFIESMKKEGIPDRIKEDAENLVKGIKAQADEGESVIVIKDSDAVNPLTRLV